MLDWGFLPVKLRRGDAESGGERLSLGSSRVVAARVRMLIRLGPLLPFAACC